MKASHAEGTYFGQADVDFTAVDTEVGKIGSDITSAEATTPCPVDTFTAIDSAIEEVIKAINGVQDEINALKDNQTAYDALVALASPALDDALADLIAHNNATSLTPAREYYDNLIQGASNDSSLKAQIAALMEAIDKALTDKKAVELTSQLTGEINSMLQTIAKTKNDITLNENAHNSQLASSDEVRNYISDLLETIGNAVSESGADPDMVADWTGTLNDLLNEGTLNEDGSVAVNGLVPVDRDVTKAYGEGASNANDSRFQAAYQQILDAAKGVASAFDSEYGDRIIETNTNTTGSWSDNWIPAMNDQYRAAINEYNSYTYGIHNTGYREAILPVLKTHEDIYQYSARITQIVSDFNQWLKAQNDGRHVITAEEYAAQVKVATDLIAEIEGKVNLMVQQVNAAAKAYYNGLYSQCWSAINDARTALTAAGVSADNVTAALAVANGHLSSAETLFVQAETANTDNVILPMDAVADQLDQVKPAIDLQTALLGQWNQSYGEASTELSALVEELNSYKKADDTLKAGNLDKLNAIIGQAADLNATATADTDLINNLRQDLANLADLLSQARDLVAEVKASNDANVAEDQALADYTAQIEDLNALYNELAEYVNSMAGTGDVDLEAVRNAIDNVDNLVKAHEGHLVANKGLIDGAINTAKGQIETTYGYTFQYEKAALESLLSDTKVAFNDAKVNSKTLTAEELETLNDEIDLLAGRISTELLNQGAATDKETFRTSALDIEQKLSAIYVKLMSSYTIEDSESGDVVSGGNPLPGILADLDSQYNTVAEAIAAGQAVLNATSEEAKAELGGKLATFTSQYEALRQALDNEKADWEAEGDVIVLSQGKYAEAMDNLLKQVNTLDSEVKAAVKAAQDEADRKAASDARYETLAAGLQSYQDTLDALRQTAADFGITSWDGFLDNIQEFIDNARTDLDSKKAAFTLTDSSELLNEAYISGQLTSATAGIHRQYTSTEISKVNADLTAATEALSGNIVPSVKAELTQQLAALKDRFQSLNDTFNATGFNGNADELQSYIVILEGLRTAAATIAEEAQSISSTAADNRFTPGDVNLEPDGVVTVADVQMVINWVGEGVTYTELAQESPRQAAAADINGDQELNIADITAIIRLALDDNDSEAEATQASPRMAIARGVRASSNVMGAAVIAENDGVRTYALTLNNTDTFVGGQIDIILPSGMEIVSATLTDRATGHDLYMFDNAQGARLIVASLSNGEIRGNEGPLVLVEVRGHGVLSTDNVVFADNASTAMKVGKADTSLIESIYNGVENAKKTIYNVAGQMMRSAQRGINIIRHSDGSTTKEMH